MSHQPNALTQTPYLDWSCAVKNLLGRHGDHESMMTTSTKTLSVEQKETPSKGEEKLANLEKLAAERLRKGLPPPREIYELPYRDRINWGAFPGWARPTDPELFEECSHEG
ncbi:MAG TPA: hypothetical protein VKE98_14540 [Gemmataceae bacterium]|nr:hypothetical protein [Gemmataceae bacterium]